MQSGLDDEEKTFTKVYERKDRYAIFFCNLYASEYLKKALCSE